MREFYMLVEGERERPTPSDGKQALRLVGYKPFESGTGQTKALLDAIALIRERHLKAILCP